MSCGGVFRTLRWSFFRKIVDDLPLDLTVYAKSFILNFRLGSEHACRYMRRAITRARVCTCLKLQRRAI